uniref:Uncharacterized protein n=1 Tax=Rhipicephalus zambeziensis TaxID=60191 RepID=A0A224Y7H0_9ACAR
MCTCMSEKNISHHSLIRGGPRGCQMQLHVACHRRQKIAGRGNRKKKKACSYTVGTTGAKISSRKKRNACWLNNIMLYIYTPSSTRKFFENSTAMIAERALHNLFDADCTSPDSRHTF